MIRQRARNHIVVVVLVLGLAWWLAGLTGLLAGAAGLTLAAVKTPRWVAGAAFGALVIAAAATVLQARPTEHYNPDFASRRPVAAEAARVAGSLAIVAIASSSVEERKRGAAQLGGTADSEVDPKPG